MRFKLVPDPPADLETVRTVQRAVPETAGGEDCCALVIEATDVETRAEASAWLTFLRALRLVAEDPAGYRRRSTEPETDRLREALRERVYGAREVLDVLEAAGRPLDVQAVYEAFESQIPAHERDALGERTRPVWEERVRRLLEWARLLGLVERVEGGYQLAQRRP